MKNYKLIALSITGKGGRPFEKYIYPEDGERQQTILSEADFEEGTIEGLLKSGHIEEAKKAEKPNAGVNRERVEKSKVDSSPQAAKEAIEKLRKQFEKVSGKKAPKNWKGPKLLEQIELAKEEKAEAEKAEKAEFEANKAVYLKLSGIKEEEFNFDNIEKLKAAIVKIRGDKKKAEQKESSEE